MTPPDPYVARRTLYLTRRQAEIDHLKGRPARVTEIDHGMEGAPAEPPNPTDAMAIDGGSTMPSMEPDATSTGPVPFV